MDCPVCGAPALSFSVPENRREFLPGDEPGAALCTRCLGLQPVSDPPGDAPDFQTASAAFPADPDAAVPMALLVGLVENLALYRSEIATLLEDVERAGVDPLLVLDRLAHDADVEHDSDLAGRRRQLEQLL